MSESVRTKITSWKRRPLWQIVVAILVLISLVTLLALCIWRAVIEQQELDALPLLEKLNKIRLQDEHDNTLNDWNFFADTTDENDKKRFQSYDKSDQHKIEAWKQVSQYNYKQFWNISLRRQFVKYGAVGPLALPTSKLIRLKKIRRDMMDIIAHGKVCPKGSAEGTQCTISQEGARTIIVTSSDPEELKHIWVGWRNATGPKCRKMFEEYVDLSNEGSKLNDFQDYSEFWMMDMEDPYFRNTIEELWETVQPLYLQLHAYVRTALRKKYGADIVSERGPIPAHLTGDLFNENWVQLCKIAMPYPEVDEIRLNVDKQMMNQGYTPEQMFHKAEEFCLSINMSAMPATVLKRSQLEPELKNRYECSGIAWNFYDGNDFRISMCTNLTYADFTYMQRQMGFIECFLESKDLPILFRMDPLYGFQTGIANVMYLSVFTTKHMFMRFPSNTAISEKLIINRLFQLSLQDMPSFHFGYAYDLWRWDVFSGKIAPKDYNCKWWEIMEKYRGLEPPVDRGDNDLDSAAYYAVPSDMPIILYFFEKILQSQFYRYLCTNYKAYDEGNPNQPLCECDIYKNKEIGNRLKKGMAMGASRSWRDALEAITGDRKMDATAILDYYKPLQKWLEQENKKSKAYIGWTHTKRACKG